MPQFLFYIFAVLAVAGAVAMVVNKNPVASALSMVGAFVGLAALFIGLNAYFVGIIQILVYAGAIMVLFIFIIMLLDLKSEEARKWKPTTIAAGIIVPLVLLAQLFGVLAKVPDGKFPNLDLEAAAANQSGTIADNLNDGKLPDVHLIGQTLFAGSQNDSSYNFPLQVIGVLLVAATVGVVVLSKKGSASKSDH